MSKVFLKRGSVYTQTDSNFQVMDKLENGIYTINRDAQTGELFLVRIADSFHFGFKLYGIDETLVNHVINTYNKQPVKRNLGVLLNGAKGTGKTVTAKIMANKLNLPVILCDIPYPGLSNFLASINHDCIFMFDEFEKNFRENCVDLDENCTGEDLLSIMDGVYNADRCHIFILTTNKLKVNDNFLSRPSRIRYLKSFGEVIDRRILEEFVDDNLIYPEYRNEIMEFIDTLSMATIDIVKSIVEEVNLHNCSVLAFKDFFNIKEASYRYYIRKFSYCIGDDDEISKTKFLNACKSGRRNDDFTPSFDTLYLRKKAKNLKVGDIIEQNYKIVELDLAKNYILCVDNNYRNYYVHYFIENIDATPNLYENQYTCAYDNEHSFFDY